MLFPLKNKISVQAIFSATAIFLSILILYISFARVGLEVIANNSDENDLRVNPISYVTDVNNVISENVYKLPEARMLSNNPLYCVKRLRDFLWISLSKEPINKSKVALLVADKKMTEAIQLLQQNNLEAALDTSEEAFIKLKYADSAVSQISQQSTESHQIKGQIIKAGYAYREILDSMKSNGTLNEEKYKQIVKQLEKWNEEKKEN